MFERYAEKSRRVIFFARYEASQVGSPTIETEHLLLGLIRDSNAVIAAHLGKRGYEESIAEQIKSHTVIREKSSTSTDLPLSNQCKRVLAYSAEESMRLGDTAIGPEHLLLGLLREKDCFAEQLLTQQGAQLERLRKELAEAPRNASTIRMGPLPPQVFELFSPKLTSAVIFAMYEASRFGSYAVETEHLLLGLVHEDKPTLDRLLESDISENAIRKEIETNGPPKNSGRMNLSHMPLTDQGKKALNSAIAEAGNLGHKTVQPGHLLLGLLREEDCFAAQMLLRRGANLLRIREKLKDLPPAP